MTKIALCSIVAISSALAAISTGVNRTYSNSIINGDIIIQENPYIQDLQFGTVNYNLGITNPIMKAINYNFET